MLPVQLFTASVLVLFGAYSAMDDNSVACKTCNCTQDKQFGGVLVQCSHLGLKRISFNLPENTTILLLDHNALTKLQARAFDGHRKMKLLDISHNQLEAVDDDAFDGLDNLKMLNLESNRLALIESTFPQNVFKPLSNLTILKLNNNIDSKNIQGMTYPHSCLQFLSSLRELYIDGLPTSFGPGFSKLINLETLIISGSNGFCRLPILENSTFVHVPFVKILNISNCQTSDTEPLVFSALKKIHTIDVSLNRGLGFTNFSKALYGVQSSTLHVLQLNNIYPRHGSCSRLSVSNIIYLKNTPLREFFIDGNGIIGMEQGTLIALPKSLKVLSVRDNRLSFGVYMFEMIHMKSLRVLDISFINKWHIVPDDHLVSNHSSWNMFLPPNLETLILSSCNFRDTLRAPAVRNVSLKKVVADHNFLNYVSASSYGYEKLEYIDFSHNVLTSIHFGVKHENNSLAHIDLSHNDLGKTLSVDFDGVTFKNLSKVRHLDLSSNRIDALPKRIFGGLTQLQSLILSENELDRFDISLNGMVELTFLDLSKNKIQSLSMSVRNDLNILGNVTLHLEGNTLSCSCHNLDFLRWMLKHRTLFFDLYKTMCLLPNETVTSLSDLDAVITELQFQCRSYMVIFAASLSPFILILMTMIGVVAYRYRWRLRRLYYVGRRKPNHDLNYERDRYTFDAFVSYADDDRGFVKNSMIPELEQKANLRLCVHDRDFIPGTVIASNITNAIQNSRKTLIILSPSFLKSDWCMFEYNMAQTEGVSRRENVIVAVMYRPVQLNDLPNDMAVLFAQYSYLEYNMNGDDGQIFWQNIIDAIGTPEPNDIE